MANNSNSSNTAATDATSIKSQTNESGAETTLKDDRKDAEQSSSDAPEQSSDAAKPALEVKVEGQPMGEAAAQNSDAPEVPEDVAALIEEKPHDVAETLRNEYNLPETWTDEQITAWFEAVATLPAGSEVSKDGVFFNDPTRAERNPADWPTEELKLALKGELDISDNKLSAVVKEYRQRESLEAAWSFRQVLDYFRDAVVPDKTSNGVWVTDVTRAERAPSDWSTAELEAWALGEITQSGKTTEAKLALELKNRLGLNAKSNNAADVIKAYKAATNPTTPEPQAPAVKPAATTTTAAPAQGLTSVNQSYIDGTIARYSDKLAPGKPISPEEGAKEQTNLEMMIQYILKLEPQGMVSGLNQLRDWVAKERETLFSASNAHRFTNLMHKDMKDRHLNFIEALRIYTDPNKDVRKQADIRYMLAKQPEDKQEMLVEWFTKRA